MTQELNEVALEAAKNTFWKIHGHEDSDRSLIEAIRTYLFFISHQAADTSNKRLREAYDKADLLTERSMGAMQIAEGDEGWERIEISCPMMLAVADLRRGHDRLRNAVVILPDGAQTEVGDMTTSIGMRAYRIDRVDRENNKLIHIGFKNEPSEMFTYIDECIIIQRNIEHH